jgi:hypothetical protein
LPFSSLITIHIFVPSSFPSASIASQFIFGILLMLKGKMKGQKYGLLLKMRMAIL